MRESVKSRLIARMSEAGLDAVLLSSPENLAWANGFVVPSQPLMRWRHALLALTASGDTGMVCVDMEETTVRARNGDGPLHVWAEFGGDPMASVVDLLGGLGAREGRIGTETRFLPAADHARLASLLPATELVGFDAALDQLRQIKDDHELALLRELSQIADRAIVDALKSVTVGSSEMDLAASLTRGVYQYGADAFKLMIVATGERSQLPNVGPTSRLLQPRDICRVEIFAVRDGYQAGVCRTAAIAEPPPHAQEIWNTLVACKDAMLASIGPGAQTQHIWDVYMAEFSRLAMPSISFVGHGIGVHLHEDPYIGPNDSHELAAGMVLGIEPLTYRTGFGFGMQLKDMIAVTNDGCELLSNVLDSPELLVVG